MRYLSHVRAPLAIIVLLIATSAALILGARAGTALVVSRPIANPDAIVSLASHEWARLPLAARLAARSPDAVVLLTLPQQVNEYNCHDCGGRVGRLVRAGVKEERIRILPITSPGTHGEALATLAFIRGRQAGRLLVVTSPYHTRRALATFRAMFAGSGTEVGIESATDLSPAQPAAWWRTPYDRWYVRYEWAAIAYYWVRYGVNAVAPDP